ISLSGSPHWDAQSLVSCGFLLSAVQIVSRPLMLLVVPVFLLVVLVHADGWVSAGSCTIPTGSYTIPTGSYSFMLLDWFLLDDHNKVAYLEKGKGWEAYEQILDFLNRSHIWYALTHHPPIVFDSLVKQLWATATVRTLKAGPSEIIATINGNEVVVTESLIRTQLQLNDVNELYEFTLHDVLDGMQEIRTYNFSRFILDGMIRNIWYKRHKFLMYPRFLQMILGIQTTDPSPRPTFDFTTKLFSNMKLNWDGPHMPLLAPMLVVHVGGDGADAAAANDVPPPPPPPDVPPTHTSSSTPGPSHAAQDTPVREPTPVRAPTLVREPTPSPVREPTTFRKPTPASPKPPSPFPYPRSEEVGPTTSTRLPSLTRQTSFQEDISEGGGDYVSSPKSNEALPTTAATTAGGAEDSVALTDLSLKLDRCITSVTTLENELGVTKKVLGGAILKLVSRVKRLEGLLQQRKRRLVLSDSEGKEDAIKEQDIDLDALHRLASTSLGGDSTVEAAYTIYKASQDAHASSDVGHAVDEVPDDTMLFRRTRTKRRRLRQTVTSSAFEHFQENISAVEDTIPVVDGIPADTQTIHAGSTPIPSSRGVFAGSSMDPAGQAAAVALSSTIPVAEKGIAPLLEEDLAKKLHAEQEAEFARQQEELAQKTQAESVASPTEQGTGLSAQPRRDLDLLGDDVNEDNMNERLGMLLMRKQRELAEQSRAKPMNKTQQRDFMRDFVKNQSASVYNQGWTMKQVKALSLAQLKHEFEYIQQTLERSNLLNFKRTIFRPTPTLEAPFAKRARQGVPQDVHAASSQVSAALSTDADVSVPAAPSIAADVSGSAAPSVHADTEVYADESHLDDPQTATEHVSTKHTVDESTPSSLHTRRKQIAKKRVTPIVDVADDALIKEICACCFSGLLMRMHMLFGIIRRAGVFAAGIYILVLSYFEAYAAAWVGSPKVARWRRFDHGQTVDFSCWFFTTQQMVFSSPWLTAKKELTHHEGTALTSVLMKKVNNVTRLQALVDKKKVIITEATIRDALRLNDAESIDCLPNEEIFTELSRMGLVRNVDSSTKFYMYPRFLQLMIRALVGDLSSHSTKYSSPALTQKVFANIRRVGKGFSRVDTPLFEGMIVTQQVDENVAEVNVDDVHVVGVADEGAASVNVDVVLNVVDEPYIPSPPPTTQPLPPSQDLPSTSQVQPTLPPSPIAQPPSPQQQPQPSHDAEISMDLLHTFLETCTTLARRVKHLEQDKIAQSLEITKLKKRVKKLERRNKLKVSKLRRLKSIGTTQRVDTSDDTVVDDVSKQGRIIASMDADVDVTLKDVADIAKEVVDGAKIKESADVQGMQAESQSPIYQIDLEYADKVLSMQDDELELAELQEVVEVVTTAKLMTEVVTAASATITTVDTLILAAIITAGAPTLTTAHSATRRRK
nr:hypothetical protein [Tanacetum cinerariifolium]